MNALFGFEHSLPNFENLTRLELDIIFDWDKLPGIVESVPNLESLIHGKVSFHELFNQTINPLY